MESEGRVGGLLASAEEWRHSCERRGEATRRLRVLVGGLRGEVNSLRLKVAGEEDVTNTKRAEMNMRAATAYIKEMEKELLDVHMDIVKWRAKGLLWRNQSELLVSSLPPPLQMELLPSIGLFSGLQCLEKLSKLEYNLVVKQYERAIVGEIDNLEEINIESWIRSFIPSWVSPVSGQSNAILRACGDWMSAALLLRIQDVCKWILAFISNTKTVGD